MTTSLITKTHPATGLVFTFRADGWFNMTKAAKHFSKSLDDFWRNKEAGEYIEALKGLAVTPADSREFVEAKAGRYGGTWAHPKLAVFFARWLDVRFADFVHF